MRSATDMPISQVASQQAEQVKLDRKPITFRQDIFTLAKVRLTAMVVITTVVGFVAGANGHTHWLPLALVAIGTWLVAGSASAINQVLEIGPDGLMDRTCQRPLPTGRLLPSTAVLFSIFTGVCGLGLLYFGCNPLTAALGLANLIIYAFVYTPLKRISTLNTLVGAICGAIPPMMGYAAATGNVGLPGCVLGLLLFVWQIPHFLALAWMYRDDYAHGGFRMLPVVDTTGRITCGMMILYSALLIPVSMAAWFFGFAGGWYAFSALLLGGGMVGLSLQLQRDKTRQHARRVFLASVIYLPLILVLLMANLRHRPVGPIHVIIAAPHGQLIPGETIAPAARP